MMWILLSEEFLNKCVTNKTGKNKGKRGMGKKIMFGCRRTDLEIARLEIALTFLQKLDT